jgi:hypothetical protein
VYVSAIAEELSGTELDRGIGVFSRRSQAHGAGGWTREDVTPPATACWVPALPQYRPDLHLPEIQSNKTYLKGA